MFSSISWKVLSCFFEWYTSLWGKRSGVSQHAAVACSPMHHYWVYSQESRHLHEPAHVLGVDQMLDGPLSQFVPFVPAAAVDGQPELHVLVLALLQVGHHLLSSSTARQRGTAPLRVHQQQQARSPEHLNDVSKVFPFDVVVRFDEDLSQDGLAYGIVFGVELVKAVKGVAVLEKQESTHFDRTITS